MARTDGLRFANQPEHMGRMELMREVHRLRQQNSLLARAMRSWEAHVGPENLPAIGKDATLAYGESLRSALEDVGA